jgi:hypothetical protein
MQATFTSRRHARDFGHRHLAGLVGDGHDAAGDA